MHAIPGISFADILAMSWPEVVTWWNVARGLLEGPADTER